MGVFPFELIDGDQLCERDEYCQHAGWKAGWAMISTPKT
jgi:hypothetical protein